MGHRDAQQAHWPVPASELGQQRAKHWQHRLCVLEPFPAADTARDELEIAPSDLERERPPCQIQFDQALFHLPGEMPQDAFHAVAVHQVALEGDFLPDRLAFPPGFDRSVVLAAHKARELAPVLAKQRTQSLLAQAFDTNLRSKRHF